MYPSSLPPVPNRRATMLGLVALIALLAWSRAALAAPTDTVITNCTNDTQLRQAVAVTGPSTITFNCGAGPQTIPISGYMQVPGTIIIEGGHQITLSGGGSSAFFQVFASGNLTLRHLTLQNGRYTGGIHPVENFGTLVLDAVVVRDNLTGGTGGTLANYNRITVQDSTFSNNRTPNTAGPFRSAGIFNDGGTATITDSLFEGNSVPGTFGTGGAISAQSGTVTIRGSTFRGNHAPDGGALFIGANAVGVVTDDSRFEANTARYGGAIESSGPLDVDHTTFLSNHATVGDGGAIWVLGSDLALSYTTIRDNHAGTTGGGVSCYSNTLSIIHSTVSGNTAGTKGGGIYSTCNLTLTNSTLSGNSAPSGGGGVFQESAGMATIAAATIAHNTAPFGAGVYNDGAGSSTLSLRNTLLANNTTGNCDGVLTSFGYNFSTDTNCSALTVTGDRQGVALPLGPLADNGGPTFTHRPLAGNPAVDAIPTAACGFATDQRDVARPQGGQCDVGAVEVAPGDVLYSLYLPLVVR